MKAMPAIYSWESSNDLTKQDSDREERFQRSELKHILHVPNDEEFTESRNTLLASKVKNTSPREGTQRNKRLPSGFAFVVAQDALGTRAPKWFR
ncbi:hypothetical protein OAF81_01395 [bacterium]|nr:hypothetical protein [bacterium]